MLAVVVVLRGGVAAAAGSLRSAPGFGVAAAVVALAFVRIGDAQVRQAGQPVEAVAFGAGPGLVAGSGGGAGAEAPAGARERQDEQGGDKAKRHARGGAAPTRLIHAPSVATLTSAPRITAPAPPPSPS